MNSESPVEPTGDEPQRQNQTATEERSHNIPEEIPQTVLNKPAEKVPDVHLENDADKLPNETEISKTPVPEEEEKVTKETADYDEEEEDDDDEDEGEIEFEPLGEEGDDEFSEGWVEEDEEDQKHVLMLRWKLHQARIQGRQKEPELPASVTRLRLQDGQKNAVVYLIGTAHFSEVSNKEVSDLIEAVLPDRIVLELDQSRSNILFMDEERLIAEAKSYNFAMFKKLAAKQGMSFAIMHYLLLRMSSSLVEQLGMAPGGEFRAAVQAGGRVPDCTVFYGDRPVGLTLRRAFGQLSFFSRLRLAAALLSSLGPVSREDVERLKQSDLVEAMVKELEAQFPILGRVFVDERDRYLTRAIYDFATMPLEHRHLLSEVSQEEVTLPEEAEQPVVLVAVVGMGHVAGIVRYWDQAEVIDRRSLCSIPEASRAGVLMRRGLKWAAIGGILYGGYCLLARLAARLF